jgi:hypothetical protein
MKITILTRLIHLAAACALAELANGQAIISPSPSEQPINNGILQSDLDFALYKALRANLSDYTASGLTWNVSTNKFDLAAPGAGSSAIAASGTPLANQVAKWTDATHLRGSTWPGKTVSVKDPPFNAAGDGVTDDSNAINSAMNAVVGAGGGTVFFPKGVYLCNGPLLSPHNAILQIPFIDANTTSAIALQLLGEVKPAWPVAAAFDFNNSATIKTTHTGTGSYPALIAASPGYGTAVIPYTSMNNIMLTIKNMSFLLPDNPSLYGVRIEAAGWAFVENCSVRAGGSEPTHGTVGFQLPSETNFSVNWANHLTVFGFDTGIMTGEHLRAPMMQAWQCKTGVAFIESIYPSWANIQLGNCVDGIKFLGTHTVDLLVETEHDITGWWAPAHDVSDPANHGTGIIRYFIGNGGLGDNIVASVDGGAGLTMVSLFSGNIDIAPGSGSGSSVGGGKITGKGTVPAGGTTGQVLAKNSDNNYSYNWQTPLTFKASTVADLPAHPEVGQIAAVIDGKKNKTMIKRGDGGGTSFYLVWFNGADWKVLRK